MKGQLPMAGAALINFCMNKNGAYGIRTHGLHNANVARSQLR